MEYKRGKSEIRMDPVSKDWVIIATNRLKRPEDFKEEEIIRDGNEKECPFCHPENEEIILYSSKGSITEKPKKLADDWDIVVVPNKYPAVSKNNKFRKESKGPYQILSGVGHHEVVITRSHKKTFFNFSSAEIKEVMDVYQNRYLNLKKDNSVKYISIFHNHGERAGASLVHPHSQIIAVPVSDPDIQKSLIGSENYWGKNKRCAHCQVIKWELKERKRIVYQNEDFVVFCPFASRMSFEMRIYPKKHSPYFETISEKEKINLADAFRKAMRSLSNSLNKPSFNFYLRTSPTDKKNYSHFHWYFEILPRLSIQAGFEFGAGIEILTIKPEKAASYLRKSLKQ